MPTFDVVLRAIEFAILIGLSIVGIGRWMERRERSETDTAKLEKRFNELDTMFVTRREYDQFCEQIEANRRERREETNRIYNRLSRLERGLR